MAAHKQSLTDGFNESADHNLFHWGHLALMVTGMALPMVLTAAPLGGATALDVVVQSGHMLIEMIENTFEYGIPVLGDIWTNALNGDFLPTTWEAGSMMPGMEEMGASFDEWLRDSAASGVLPDAIEESGQLGQTLQDYMMEQYGHEGH